MTPAAAGGSLADRIRALSKAIAALESEVDGLESAGHEIARRLRRGGTVYTLGNGGGAGLAAHLTGEFVGRLSAARERGPLSSVCLSSDLVALTALANDYGFAAAHARLLTGLAGGDDVLVTFTTSGRSENLLNADRVAAERGLYRVALVGEASSSLDSCDVVVRVSSRDPATIQEGQLLVLHALVESTENALGGGTRVDQL